MNKPVVRCRCGHQVLGKEVLRVDPYERSSGREMVYVKYRCRRCKKLGEAFIPESEWDMSIFEAPRNEMSELERDRFLDKTTISSGDVLTFHRDLKRVQRVSDFITANEARPRLKDKADAPKGKKGNGEAPSGLKGRP